METSIWVVLKIMGPLWLEITLRHRIPRATKNGTLILGTTHIILGP